MIKTMVGCCPKCGRKNPFNVPIEITDVKQIDAPWFQCNFCFEKSNKEDWK
jgi:hypothetical protein